MKKISQAIVVEGTYDKIKLSSILDAVIIETAVKEGKCIIWWRKSKMYAIKNDVKWCKCINI